MSVYLGEFIGTIILVLLGDGVCCNVNLEKSGFKGGGAVHILIGWGMAVMVPAFAMSSFTGCPSAFNPAVTIGIALRTGDWSTVPGQIVAQLLGGFVGAAILILLYHDHINATGHDDTVRGCFCTAPSIPNPVLNFLSEFVATFVLVFTLALIPGAAGESNVSWVLVYGVIVACGASFGGLTGYAMNAARDSAPRLAYQLLAPNFGKKNANWGYGWIPLVAPICGGVVASLLYNALAAAQMFG
ncbi:MIP/aquaporin family protein [Pseudobutyrivibrio sp.]|uniref:MIP/aquaporin family protein n=1 Tax=Pseudobutyrivibrio sp. TaxID=2014367 RepID=UPI001B585168|nr:MIP/aquaporin family protein [Pseudobutyrivibrio sp.]MBP3728548.1 aquaporin family protein [Pseudobutyrivibrio sp.]MBQ6461931.1 aquaporin family protein [Pseudobutyrivibrio sp.]MBQ8488935.1 aquaporin family protein [Pseudobutyrivibrio sp.]